MHILADLAVLYWSFILLNTLLNLLFVRRIRPRAPVREPFVSIVVPARNEERAIEATVRAFLAQSYRAFEVIVVDDRSTDSTAAILERLADPKLEVVRGEEPPAGWLGKPWALHQGAARARGELLLFVDADIRYAPDALQAAVAEIERSGASMLSLFPHLEMHGVWELSILPNLTMTGFTALPLWIGDRAGVTLFAIGGGTGNLIRRAAYDAIGGHEALRAAIVDDIALARDIRRSGRRTELVRADDLISVRMYHGLHEAIRGFTKNAFTTINRSYAMLAVAVAGLLLFNVLPYGFALMGIGPAIVAVALLTLTRIIVFGAVRYPLWGALLLHPLQSILWMFILIRSAWVTGVRGQVAWRGRTYDAAQTRFGSEER